MKLLPPFEVVTNDVDDIFVGDEGEESGVSYVAQE